MQTKRQIGNILTRKELCISESAAGYFSSSRNVSRTSTVNVSAFGSAARYIFTE
jgi:hypothetical protein